MNRLGFRIFSLALISGFLFSSAPVLAASDKVTEKHKDWTLVCETLKGAKDEFCFLTQILTVKETGKPLMRVTVSYPGNGDKALMLVTLPLGIALAPGMGFQLDDGKPRGVPFDRCLPVGCNAGLPLSPTLIEAMKKGTQIKVMFADGKGKKKVLPISLSGFTAGFASMGK